VKIILFGGYPLKACIKRGFSEYPILGRKNGKEEGLYRVKSELEPFCEVGDVILLFLFLPFLFGESLKIGKR